MTSNATPPRSRAQVWILIALFFAPLLVAFLLYYGMDGWRPAGRTNYGELVQPPLTLPQVALISADGKSVPAALLTDKWTLVYIGSGECDARCREALALMRQTRLALGDDMSRVQRLFLVTEDCCDRAFLDTEHAGLIVARLSEAEGPQLERVFRQTTSEPLDEAGRIYIVDPLGNLMMQYAPGAEPKGLLEDLERLLKLSHIG